ncbi:DUF6348 family protein [Actinoallomurus sp. NBC_01490]|uniref:DUF6348 family protein n=1 Tax=Actinoallomurus sp. NBC_01490 TaxID=2903557 RepID=UPI002E368D36|nr:DUF6348 family protein [Actinoallomurus sp. NBC_01490]
MRSRWRRNADGDGRAALSEQAVLAIVAEQLSEMSGRPFELENGRVKGPGSTAVVLAKRPDHAGGDGHLDLDFVLNVDRPQDTTITDCVAGYGESPEAKVRQAVEMWAGTTVSAVLELLAQNGRFAAHLAPDDPDGLPGWHAIHGGVIGWGTGERYEAASQWLGDHAVLPDLAPALTGEPFERHHLIGVKVFFGSTDGTDTAEVRVNGRVHPAASQALRDIAWPRTAGSAYARTFILLVHGPETH